MRGAEGWVFFAVGCFELLEGVLGLGLSLWFWFCDRRDVGKWLGIRV